jgi:hypothetical protein
VRQLRGDERVLAEDIARLTDTFLARRTEFEALEPTLKAEAVEYTHPAQRLEEVLKADRERERERKLAVKKHQAHIRRSLNSEKGDDDDDDDNDNEGNNNDNEGEKA